ncbi:hypothetical protein D3C74_75130 [compost metagenome]
MAASALGVMYAVYAWYGHDWNVQWLYGSYSYLSAASAPSLVLVILLGLLLTLLLSSGRVTLSMSWLVEPRLERIFKGEKRRQWQ